MPRENFAGALYAGHHAFGEFSLAKERFHRRHRFVPETLPAFGVDILVADHGEGLFRGHDKKEDTIAQRGVAHVQTLEFHARPRPDIFSAQFAACNKHTDLPGGHLFGCTHRFDDPFVG